ncbi:MAG: RodZ domain-containing protein [Cyanobacteria bacterium J06621_11]
MTKFSAAQQSQLAQIGAFLRENREKQGKSLEDIAIHTYIRPQLLNGIEMGDPDLLPEPIFVQGFIRRYAENLGLKGRELSQQFTVTSIPSTPRPAPRAPDTESSTTRLTRPVASSNNQLAMPAVTSNTMFSAGNLSPVGEPFPNNAAEGEPAKVQAQGGSQADNQSVELNLTDIPVVSGEFEAPPVEAQSAELLTPELPTVEAPNAEAPATDDPMLAVDSPGVSEDFADKVAAFDQANLSLTEADLLDPNLPDVAVPAADIPAVDEPMLNLSDGDVPDVGVPIADVPVAASSTTDTSTPALSLDASEPAPQLNEQLNAPLDNQKNGQFDDGLPAAFTTQVTTTEPGTAPRTAYSTAPVGVEMGSDLDGPNLKPFAIGAVVLAAVTAGIVLFANLLGGDRTPSVAENPEPATAPTPESVEPIAEAPDPTPPAPAPAASTKPVYVEAEATAETYVSVRVDGVIIFEEIMQPGDTLLWEGEEVIDVYSGNAGGLTIAANGGPSEVLGEDGQLGQKVFEAQ